MKSSLLLLLATSASLPEPIVVTLNWNSVEQFVPATNPHEVRLFSETREGFFVGMLRHLVTKRLLFFTGTYLPFNGGLGAFSGPDHVAVFI